jgi:dolichyl-phosphate-mannose-protein mannosyltransferase
VRARAADPLHPESPINAATTIAPTPPRRLPEAGRLAILFLMAVALRVVVIANTTLVSRDCIVFVRYALDLEDPPSGVGGALGVIRANEHPPGYPLAILAVSKVVRPFTGGETVPTMALSAQIVSALAGILLTVPFYLFTRRILGRNSAFAATAVFGVLPGFVEVTGDGISDGLYWLTIVTALWFAARAMRGHSRAAARRNGLGAGLSCGLGYWVRPDAAGVALAIGLTLLGLVAVQWARRIRSPVGAPPTGEPIRARFQAGLLLIAGFGLVAVPYMVIIDGPSNKPTFKAMFDRLRGREIDRTYFDRAAYRPAVRLPLAAWWDATAFEGQSRPVWALKALGNEYAKAAHYILPAFGLIGLFALRRRLSDPRVALLLVVAGVQAVLLWLLAWAIGYVSQRHTMLIVLVTCVFAAAGFDYLALLAIKGWQTEAVGRRTVRFLAPLAGRGAGESFVRAMREADPRFLVAIWVVIVMAVAVPRNFRSLHEERAGHKAAGLWMKVHVPPECQIVDPFGWAEWYTGRTLRAVPNPNPYVGPCLYAVFEPNARSPHSRLEYHEYARRLAEHGEIAFQFPAGVPPDQIKVAVYKAPPLKP